MGDTKATIEAKIKAKKVVMFSKKTCPYCKMAKDALSKYVGSDELPDDQYEVMEIDTKPQFQAELKKMTGASTVPRVFINGTCIGGGTETKALASKPAQMKAMLAGKA